jgi:hypothetical protein
VCFATHNPIGAITSSFSQNETNGGSHPRRVDFQQFELVGKRLMLYAEVAPAGSLENSARAKRQA